MIGQALAHGDNSVTATAAISSASVTAIAAVAGKDDTGVARTIVPPRLGIRPAPGISGGPDQGGNHRHENHNHPEEYLAQIPAPSAVDYVEGNQR